MAKINGGSISVDSATKAQLEQSLKSTESDRNLTIRIKTTRNGTIQILVDKGTSGNFFARIVNKIFFQKRDAHNQAVAFAWLNQFAKTGSTGATVSQRSIETSLASRSVVTVDQALKLLAKGSLIDKARELVIQGNSTAIKTLLASTDNAETINHLKAPLNGMAKSHGLTPEAMQAYNEVLKREAWVIGTNAAKGGSSAAQITSTLESTEFSSRPKLNAELKAIAQQAAIDHRQPQASKLPDTSELAYYFGDGLAHGDTPEFQKRFTEGVRQMVSDGTLEISNLEYMTNRLDEVGSLRSDPPSLQQLAESISAKIGRDKGEAPAPRTNAQHFDALKKQTTEQMRDTDYSPVSGHFKDMKSPAATNVAVAIPQNGKLAPAKQGQIHANHIPFPEKTSAIATQYPAKGDTGRATFWRMTLQQGTNLIVDLTQPVDLTKGKGLELYYPTEVGVPEEYDDVRVTLTGQTDGYNEYEVTDTITGETSHTYRYHYDKWVDHGNTNIEDIAALANMVSHESFENTVIHCRAGVGRTATVYCAARLMNMMRRGKITPANRDDVINNMILEMRIARGSAAVQTESQRQLLSNLVDHWITNGVD